MRLLLLDPVRLLDVAAAWDAMPAESRRRVGVAALALMDAAAGPRDPRRLAQQLAILDAAGGLQLAVLDGLALRDTPIPVRFPPAAAVA